MLHHSGDFITSLENPSDTEQRASQSELINKKFVPGKEATVTFGNNCVAPYGTRGVSSPTLPDDAPSNTCISLAPFTTFKNY